MNRRQVQIVRKLVAMMISAVPGVSTQQACHITSANPSVGVEIRVCLAAIVTLQRRHVMLMYDVFSYLIRASVRKVPIYAPITTSKEFATAWVPRITAESLCQEIPGKSVPLSRCWN
jgi:hypothetical protein